MTRPCAPATPNQQLTCGNKEKERPQCGEDKQGSGHPESRPLVFVPMSWAGANFHFCFSQDPQRRIFRCFPKAVIGQPHLKPSRTDRSEAMLSSVESQNTHPRKNPFWVLHAAMQNNRVHLWLHDHKSWPDTEPGALPEVEWAGHWPKAHVLMGVAMPKTAQGQVGILDGSAGSCPTGTANHAVPEFWNYFR